jgi:hypothetical protein
MEEKGKIMFQWSREKHTCVSTPPRRKLHGQ